MPIRNSFRPGAHLDSFVQFSAWRRRAGCLRGARAQSGRIKVRPLHTAPAGRGRVAALKPIGCAPEARRVVATLLRRPLGTPGALFYCARQSAADFRPTRRRHLAPPLSGLAVTINRLAQLEASRTHEQRAPVQRARFNSQTAAAAAAIAAARLDGRRLGKRARILALPRWPSRGRTRARARDSAASEPRWAKLIHFVGLA